MDLGGNYSDLRAFISLMGYTDSRLTFDVAYAQYSDYYSDTLAILASADCGLTFTELYRRGGDDLASAPDYTDGVFYPEADDWRTDTIDISSMAGEESVLLAFRNIGRWGQALYIDNVNVESLVISVDDLPAAGSVNIYPNPVEAGRSVTVSGNINDAFSVEIFNTNGVMVLKETLHTNQTLLLDKSLFAAGIYSFRLKGEKFMRVGKLVVM